MTQEWGREGHTDFTAIGSFTALFFYSDAEGKGGPLVARLLRGLGSAQEANTGFPVSVVSVQARTSRLTLGSEK